MKALKIFTLLIFTLIITFAMAACSNDKNPTKETTEKADETTAVEETTGITDNVDGNIVGEPSSELLKKVEVDYVTFLLKDHKGYRYAEASVCEYYGNFNGAVAAEISGGGQSYHCAEWTQKVAGFEIHYNDGQFIWVWKDGDFYTLPEAYENGILTKENIKAISKTRPVSYTYPREEYSYIEELSDRSQLPLPKLVAPDEKAINNLEVTFKNYNIQKFENDTFYPLARYYGTFKGSHLGTFTAVMFEVPISDTPLNCEKEVAGSVIKYTDERQIMVYVENSYGSYYTLEEAFDKGYLTDVEIAVVAEIHNRGEYISFDRP